MNEALRDTLCLRMERAAEALRRNNMAAYCVAAAADVVPLIKTLVPEGALVGAGGSMSLAECGVMDLLRSGCYRFLDRNAPGADVGRIYRETFFADCYFASANAVTEEGEIFNVDGNVGCNKIVRDVPAAEARVRELAAPANARRLSCQTPCAATGQCRDCHSPARICCTYVLHRYQREAERIKVILVGEPLGF